MAEYLKIIESYGWLGLVAAIGLALVVTGGKGAIISIWTSAVLPWLVDRREIARRRAEIELERRRADADTARARLAANEDLVAWIRDARRSASARGGIKSSDEWRMEMLSSRPTEEDTPQGGISHSGGDGERCDNVARDRPADRRRRN